jgi:hypothetical protein
MTQGGKRVGLDEIKKGEIVALVSVGCSRRIAAGYVGCAVSTIRRTALRDPQFAKRLRRATYNAQVGYLKNIKKAAEKEQYWRAAAWALERLNPEDFGPRSPDTITKIQFFQFLAEVAKVVVEETGDQRRRQSILKRVNALVAALIPEPTQEVKEDETQP